LDEHDRSVRETGMPIVTWDHIHLRSPDPEATAAWLEEVLGGEIVRGPGRIDVRLGGANIFIANIGEGDAVNPPPITPYQGLDHFGLTVKDIDMVAAEIKAKGVEFTREPTPSGPACGFALFAVPRASRSNYWSGITNTGDEIYGAQQRLTPIAIVIGAAKSWRVA
jgi:catechol 2,3-dioxygenase-like lactoylglutathione lyase family enzyme